MPHSTAGVLVGSPRWATGLVLRGLGLSGGLTLGSSGRAALPVMKGQGEPARR